MILTKKIFYILFILLFTITIGGVLQADTVEQIQEKIDNANENRQQLEKEIAKYQDQLRVVSDQAATLQNNIKSLDISANKITTEVKLTETDINKTSYNIEDTNLEITNKERQIIRNNQIIKESLKQISEADNMSIWEVLLTNENLSGFWIELDDTIQVQAKLGSQVITARDIKANLEKARVELEQKKSELEKYTKELAAKKTVLQSTKNEKSNLLSTTKNTEANYQKLLKEKLAKKEALDQEINQFESQIKLIVDPKSFPPAGKGVLKWPLDTIYITQYFGVTSVSGRLYASGSHNGVDFRAPIGTRVLSAGSGVVEGVGDTDIVCKGASYGKWVLIRYDNGLASVYGHLSLITAKQGQRVNAGDVVAYSGNTGYSTGPHLHMSVFAGQGVQVTTLKSKVCNGTYTLPLADPASYLDPMIYL